MFLLLLKTTALFKWRRPTWAEANVTSTHPGAVGWPVKRVSQSQSSCLGSVSSMPNNPLPLFPSIFQPSDAAQRWRGLTTQRFSLLCLCGMEHMFPESWWSLILPPLSFNEGKEADWVMGEGMRLGARARSQTVGDSPRAAPRGPEACLTRGARCGIRARQPAVGIRFWSHARAVPRVSLARWRWRMSWLRGKWVSGLQISVGFSKTGITPVIQIKAIRKYIKFFGGRGGYQRRMKRKRKKNSNFTRLGWRCWLRVLFLLSFYFHHDHFLLSLNIVF